jgi:hypothetical protein
VTPSRGRGLALLKKSYFGKIFQKVWKKRKKNAGSTTEGL